MTPTPETTATPTTSADVIDVLTGIRPASARATVRAGRAQARENAQRSFAALLEPTDASTFSHAERYAVAAFVSALHAYEPGRAFYADLLADEDESLAVAVADAIAALGTVTGPLGAYREEGLAAESTAAPVFAPDASALGDRLAAALAHAHLLVVRPRESSPAALGALVDAGWSADDIVTLSQLVAFLAFQLRVAWGLRVLGGEAATAQAETERADAEQNAGETDAAHASAPAGPEASTLPAGVTAYPDLGRPDRFTQDGLGWVPWLEPVAQDALSARQHEALIDDFRRANPYFRLLVRNPDALEARTLTDLDIFYNTDGGVGRAERELAATVASRLNGCVYCASVHSAAATRESRRRDDVQRLLDEGVTADLGSPAWNAIAEASVALTHTPPRFDATHIEALRAVEFDDAAIADIVQAAAFFNWANRLMLSLGEPEVPARRRGDA